MKWFKIALFALLIAGFSSANEAKAQPGISVNVDFNTFYDGLSPYGRWVDHGNYGRVWVYNEPGFRPYYTNGHWDYTEYGWTWTSDYDWGWGPFHYGRWEEDPEMGWFWIPGYDWAPAWVSWSEADDYYGWAPLGYGYDLSVSIGTIPYDRWCFLPRGYITSPRFYDYCVPFSRNRSIYRNAYVINNFYEGGGHRYFMGPNRGEVERYTHNRIEPRRIQGNERYGFVERGYRNGGNRGGMVERNERGINNGNIDRQNRGNYRNDQGRNDGYRNDREQQRNDNRERIFGRPQAEPNRQNPINNNPVINSRPENGRVYNQNRNNYNQAPATPPAQQQRPGNAGQNYQPREQQRPYSGGNPGGDQRINNRTESRQRIFGNERNSNVRPSGGGERQQQGNSNNIRNEHGGGERGRRG